MIKKTCLKCGKEFEAKKDTAKYCSDSCKVIYNRNNSKIKSDEIKPIQMQVMYNVILQTFEEFKKLIDTKIISPVKIDPTPGDPIVVNISNGKTFQQFLNEISELDTEHEYRTKAFEIESSDLTRKQKDLLLINMRTSKL